MSTDQPGHGGAHGGDGQGSATDHALVTVRLEMEPDEFAERQKKFVLGLAHALDVPQSDIKVLGYRAGCVNVDLQTLASAIKRLDEAARDPSQRSEAVAALFNEFKISRVTPAGAPFSEPLLLLREGGREFTWLHLSDLHLEASGSKHSYGQDVVRSKFLEQLPEALAAFDIEPNIVFVSGDLSYSAEPEQFDQALTLFSDLKNALPIADVPIMAVPGNHDVQWGAVTGTPTDLDNEVRAREELSQHLIVDEFLRNDRHKAWRESLFKRLDNFSAFAAQAAPFGQPALNHGLFFSTALDHCGFKIGIAGLNSAWRSSHEDDRYRLLLTRLQIDTARQALRDTQLRIALVHHPVESDWFAPFDVSYQRVSLSAFDFVLRGHEHDPHVAGVIPGARGAQHRVSAGALYTNDDYQKSFNAVRINLDRGNATAYFWRLAERNLVWVPDVESFPRDGREHFALAPPARRRLGVAESSGAPPSRTL